jgi:hypothetical protein
MVSEARVYTIGGYNLIWDLIFVNCKWLMNKAFKDRISKKEVLHRASPELSILTHDQFMQVS